MSAAEQGGKRIGQGIEHRFCGSLQSLNSAGGRAFLLRGIVFCKMGQVHHGPG